MTEENSLQEALEKLSSKKHVLQPELEKKDNNKFNQPQDTDVLNNQLILTELQQSIRLLMSFFYTSKFDELLCLLAQPTRLFVLNIIMGFLRGLGFSIAFFIFLYLMMSIFFPQLMIQFS